MQVLLLDLCGGGTIHWPEEWPDSISFTDKLSFHYGKRVLTECTLILSTLVFKLCMLGNIVRVCCIAT